MVQKEKNWDSRISEKLFDGAKNLTQLALSLHCNRNTLSRELQRLVANGYLFKFKQKNEIHYALNSKAKHDPLKIKERIRNLENYLKHEDQRITKLKKLPYIFKKNVKGYQIKQGEIDDPNETSLVSKVYLTEVLTFKINRNAEKSLKEIVKDVDFHLGQASFYSLKEAFNRLESGLTKKDARKIRDLNMSCGQKLIHDLINIEPKTEGCLHEFMMSHSSYYVQLGSFVLPPKPEVIISKNSKLVTEFSMNELERAKKKNETVKIQFVRKSDKKILKEKEMKLKDFIKTD